MPLAIVNKLPSKKETRTDCDVFNNGQRLVVVVGGEKRMLKVI
jgi:hypothetical protein